MIHRHFIGLSSGASHLGVDAVLVRADGLGTELALHVVRYHHLPYSHEFRELLWHVSASPTPEIRHVAAIHRVLGETYALAVRQLLEQSRRPSADVLCIGCSGLTLAQRPDGRYPSTLNLGMTSVLAERTDLTTLSDFSSRDIALGGQGVPTTALVDAMLFHDPGENRAILHLGTSATLVWLPADPGPKWRHVLGFQAAPCMMLLDGLIRLMTKGSEPFDAGGKHAVQGRCLEPLLQRWMRHPYFQRRPPKSVPRGEFNAEFLNACIVEAQKLQGNLHDVLCTMTHFVVHAIVHSLTHDLATLPTRVILSGKGVRNGFLWHLLEQKLHSIVLEKTDDHGVPAEAHKALAHAGLAALAMDGVPASVPSATGASGARVLGHFTPGSSSNWSRCLAWMSRLTAAPHAAAA